MKKFREHWKPIIFTICILLFLAIVALLLGDKIPAFDEFVYNIVSKVKCGPVTVIAKILSFFCSTWFILVFTVLCMVFMHNKKQAFYIALNVILCVLLNQSLKHLFLRPRPTNINLVIENGYSFPSGHSMVSLAFYGFFIYIIYHMRISKKKKYIYCSLLALLTLLIGLSRIYLGVHYASDVLAGFALSMAYLIIYIKVFYKKIGIF